MASFCRDHSATVYVVAATKKDAQKFAKRKGLTDAVCVGGVEDLPREKLTVILVDGYSKHIDYECLFGVGGLFYDFRADIYYGHEVPACH